MRRVVLMMLAVSALTMIPGRGFGDDSLFNLGPEKLVRAGGVVIQVPGYSVPSFVDWNDDNLGDLLVGEGGGGHAAKVRVYLNTGTESEPQFSDYFYVQSRGSDLNWAGSEEMGCFPRVVYWDADDRKDLLVGLADGTVKILLNTGTESEPVFLGESGVLAWWNMYRVDIGEEATVALLDWDNDGRIDLVAGALDGKIHVYINCGCDGAIAPSFFKSWPSGELVQENGEDLIVPSERSSPVVLDIDGDGKKDLLTGNSFGELLFYRNVGIDAAPSFSGYTFIDSNSVPIDLSGLACSRPFVCDWTGDGYPDVLMGAGDGNVHLYQSLGQPGDIDKDYDVDLVDVALFGIYWQQIGCGKCCWADFTDDGRVDADDLAKLAARWLEEADL
jgi:hypothetical protein